MSSDSTGQAGGHDQTGDREPEPQSRWLKGRFGERAVFVLLAIVIWPIIAVAVVGGYGFVVWMYQILAGPPGPPAG